ncbi:MAG: fibronectin type III domain-containing protein, partial [Planctomycetaceae bacterium]|nr:fibronectin type III domain-containing protein [Planctomycetaceae bacterium]
GVKYDVSVTAIAYNGTNVVKAGTSKVSVATAKFSEPTLKIPSGQKAGLTSVEFAVEDKIKDPTDFNSRKYLLEYTYIADAKGKADWSTAEVQHVVDPATNFTLSNLKAGTQYYARLVAYNNSYDSMHSTPEKGTDQTNSDVIVIGKELKFKTVAVPLATLTKPAFALDNYELALKFTGKIPVDKTGNNAVLQNDTKFFYELIVSTDAVIDKVTGKLANGKSVTLIPAVLEALGTGKNKDEFKTPITQKLTGTGGAFEKLQVGSLDLATFKALNFQLLVYYTTSDAEHAYASAYTKIAKLALPKWFV